MLAGRGSTIWTHNRRRSAPVRIGDFCYVGSECRFAPGVTIPDCTMIAIGSVVSASFDAPFTAVGGAPARIVRRLVGSDADTMFAPTRPDLPAETVPAIPRVAPPATPRFGSDDLESSVRHLVAEAGRVSAGAVDLSRELIEQGVDSLQLLVLRETIENRFDVHIPDADWLDLSTPDAIIGYLSRAAARPVARPVEPRAMGGGQSSVVAVADLPAGLAYDELEIGMPLTGRHNLAETPLLQRLGDQRWRHISDVMGVLSRDIVDDEGDRLYATFFYVEMAFPEARPMASFGENDRFVAVSAIGRYGSSMVDGVTYLLPAGSPVGPRAPFASLEDAVSAGVPCVRLSNIFVKQFAGAEWLKKGRPADAAFARIPPVECPPDSYEIVKRVDKQGFFERPGSSYVPLTNGAVRREYRLVPDRDLNGAGLVYFANYPMFLDICERDVLRGAAPLSDQQIDRRTLVRRRSAYLNNASSKDTLLIDVEPWLKQSNGAGGNELRLHVDYRMYRQSDGRLMMVSAAEKIITGSQGA